MLVVGQVWWDGLCACAAWASHPRPTVVCLSVTAKTQYMHGADMQSAAAVCLCFKVVPRLAAEHSAGHLQVMLTALANETANCPWTLQ